MAWLQPNRRQTVRSLAGGSLLLPGLLADMLAGQPDDPLRPRKPHYEPKAKQVIFLFMTGGVSHVDTFDPKPFLRRHHDKPFDERRAGGLRAGGRRRWVFKGSDWNFQPYGQSGTEVSELFPHIGGVIDDIAVIRSMRNINGDHFGATLGIHTGSATFNRPSIGSWVSYGLGTFNRNLPSFMVLAPQIPYAGGQVWGSDFLPVLHQGTRIVPGAEPIMHMRPRTSGPQQRTELDLLEYFNRQHLRGHELKSSLAARIQSFETAFGMQTEAPEVFDLATESEATLKLYGLERGSAEGFGWQCLVARRLVERGVRFIELIDGGTRADKNWDAHARMANYNGMARNVDQPIAGLLRDLKGRGLLDETLVAWTTEFGRTPTCASPGAEGRDHHARAYTSWLAGGGIRRGLVYGASDEIGHDIAEHPVTVHDFQATILDRLGLDHERLTYHHAGRDFRLTDVHGHVIKELLL